MFTWNDKFNLNIDYTVFDYMMELEKSPTLKTEDLHYCLLAMIAANAISNPYAPMVYVTLDSIIITIAEDINFKAKPKLKTGLMNAFNTLAKYRIIKMNEPFNGDKKQLVSMDCHKLVHDVENAYIQISREELATIIKGSNNSHHLMAIMLNYCSRFNIPAMNFLVENKWMPNISLAVLKDEHDLAVTDFKALSTWISQDIAKSTWANYFNDSFERKNVWSVEQAMFSRYCKELVDLGVLDRLVVNEPGKKISYYFRPMHKKCVEWAINMNIKQQDHMVEKKRGSFVNKHTN